MFVLRHILYFTVKYQSQKNRLLRPNAVPSENLPASDGRTDGRSDLYAKNYVTKRIFLKEAESVDLEEASFLEDVVSQHENICEMNENCSEVHDESLFSVEDNSLYYNFEEFDENSFGDVRNESTLSDQDVSMNEPSHKLNETNENLEELNQSKFNIDDNSLKSTQELLEYILYLENTVQKLEDKFVSL